MRDPSQSGDELVSSLRRVTAAPAATEAADAPPRPARLMLTPALRVDGGEDPARQRLAAIEAQLAAADRACAGVPEAEFHDLTRDEPEAEARAAEARDSELLRGLIRDVLREELQGEVGERVSRSLRRLIRAEVGRALALQRLRDKSGTPTNENRP